MLLQLLLAAIVAGDCSCQCRRKKRGRGRGVRSRLKGVKLGAVEGGRGSGSSMLRLSEEGFEFVEFGWVGSSKKGFGLV